jgi:hypothetical protein
LQNITLHFIGHALTKSKYCLLLFQYLLITSSSAPKVGKNLLKKRTSCYRLYTVYALVEERKRPVHQRKGLQYEHEVFPKMSNVATSTSYDPILLRRTWILERLRKGDVQEAVHLLLSVSDDQLSIPYQTWPSGLKKDFSPSSVLKVRSYLQHGQERCFFNKEYAEAMAYVEVLAWFTYFQRNSQQLLEAMSVFEEAKNKTSQDLVYYRELLDQGQVALLNWHRSQHGSSRSFRPADIKPILVENVGEFPDNTLLRNTYLDHQQSFGLEDRLRQIDVRVQIGSNDESIISWLFEIFSETRRLPELGGTTHGLRSVFNKAVDSTRYIW